MDCELSYDDSHDAESGMVTATVTWWDSGRKATPFYACRACAVAMVGHYRAADGVRSVTVAYPAFG